MPINRVTVGLAAAEVITVADLRRRMGVVDLFPGRCATGRLIYLADMAVDPSHQGRGVGKLLFEARQRCIKEQGHVSLPQYVRVRRRPTASITHEWYVARGARVVYEYPIEDGRVILHVDPQKVLASRSAA